MAQVYVLVRVQHVYDPAKGHPDDVHQWLSVHPSFEEATFAGAQYAESHGLLGSDPVYIWWKMAPERYYNRWWMSNEFGRNKHNVGNSMRVLEVGRPSEADRLDPVGQGSTAA